MFIWNLGEKHRQELYTTAATGFLESISLYNKKVFPYTFMVVKEAACIK